MCVFTAECGRGTTVEESEAVAVTASNKTMEITAVRKTVVWQETQVPPLSAQQFNNHAQQCSHWLGAQNMESVGKSRVQYVTFIFILGQS